MIRVAGAWLLRGARPSAREVERELDRRPVPAVGFDTGGLGAWDSALLAFLVHVQSACRERAIPIDPAGLPQGIHRLLALATAVPEHAGARAGAPAPDALARIGLAALRARDGVLDTLRFTGEVTLALGRWLTLRARFQPAELWLQIQQCGAQAFGIVTLVSFLVGLILAFMGAVQLARFGATIYVADLVAIGMSREMGAVMAAVVMSGRTGAAFAAQLGTMKVTEEIDALRTMGIPPIDRLVLPRVLALTFMLPLLCLYADFMGILGGLVVAQGMLGLSPVQYLTETKLVLSFSGIVLGVVKAAVFGVLIAGAGCLRGLQCGDSASAVGDATTRAVVTSIVLIIVVDGLFAVVTNVLGI